MRGVHSMKNAHSWYATLSRNIRSRLTSSSMKSTACRARSSRPWWSRIGPSARSPSTIPARTSAFDEADLRLLGLFASSAAVVIENARLFGETRRRALEFEILYEATKDIGSHQQDLPSLLTTLVEKAARLLGCYGSGIYLYDPAARGSGTDGRVHGTAGYGRASEAGRTARLAGWRKPACRWSLTTTKPGKAAGPCWMAPPIALFCRCPCSMAAT